MQSKAATVAEYLAELPSDRRAALQAVRKVILANLDRKGYEERMSYGMIGYAVPHRVFPAGYHCDPKQPLPFAGLASQKNHMSLYMMCLYSGSDEGTVSEHQSWFRAAWGKTGKKLDMGKSCIRFQKLEDLPLAVIGEAIRRMPAKTYIEAYKRSRDAAPVSRAEIQARMKQRAAQKQGSAAQKKAAKAPVQSSGAKRAAVKKKARTR